MRRPIDAEVRGLQTPRERVWSAIRRLKNGFTTLSVQDACEPMVLISCVEDYFKELEPAGFIRRVSKGKQVPGRSACVTTAHEYELVRNQFEAPRLSNGKAVTAGSGVLAMWRAMKVLNKGFDYTDIARAASLEQFVVKPSTAHMYVNALARAGYLQTLRAAKPGTPARFRLQKNTGPHAPAITRLKCVFDRNTGEFAQLQTAQEVCDGIE
jgi:hypothetical protein